MGLLEVLLGVCVCGAESDGLRGFGYVVTMVDDHPAVLVRLDEELIGLAHHGQRVGQPQASAVWQTTDGDQMVRLGWSREQHDEDFPVAILITITKVRAS